MRKAVFATLIIAMASVAVAEKKEKKKDDRWKITIGGVPVGLEQISGPTNGNVNYRSEQGIRSWRANYYNEYIVPNSSSILDDRANRYFLANTDVRCCRENFFTVHTADFRGNVGDEYLMWAKTENRGVRHNGIGFATSLEYRTVAGLWTAFSFQVSDETEMQRTEAGEYTRVTEIERFPADRYYNFSHPVPYWSIKSSRHRITRRSEHKYRFYTFSLLAKYDLTRGSEYWSIMPQAGAEVYLGRERMNVTERYYDWRIFSGEYHSSSWAQQPQEVDARKRTSVDWWDTFRPVAGMSVELYPGGKRSFVGIMVDGRYRFNTNDDVVEHTYGEGYWMSTFASDRSFIIPYRAYTAPRDWTIAVSGVIRF